MDSYVSPKEEIWFLRVRHHISNAVYYKLTPHPFAGQYLEFKIQRNCSFGHYISVYFCIGSSSLFRQRLLAYLRPIFILHNARVAGVHSKATHLTTHLHGVRSGKIGVVMMMYLLTAVGLSPGGSTHLHTNNT